MIGEAELLRLIGEEQEKQRDLAATLDLHRALIAGGAEPPVVVEAGFPGRARARLAEGRPAIEPAALELDWAAVVALGRRVCEIAARHEATLAPAFAEVEAWLADATTAEVHEIVRRHLARSGVSPEPGPRGDVLGFVLTHALRPRLRAYAAAAAPMVEASGWRAGHCPVCGGEPDFAALEGQGERRLLCARCDTEWPFRRVGCPFCGSEDAERLGYFPTGQEAYRLYVCDGCQAYLKTVDLRETWRRRPLALERILTVGMDVGAAEQGYGARQALARNGRLHDHPLDPGVTS